MSERADRPTLSIIIPTCNHAPHLAATVGHALLAAGGENLEFVISDYGSTDETIAQARRLNVKSIAGGSCRVDAMNRGVSLATGETLLFLSPRSRLPDLFDQLIERAMRSKAAAGGVFEFGVISHPRWTPVQRAWFGLVETFQKARYRWGVHVCRDAAIFLRREFFEQIGGFRHDAPHPAGRLCGDLRRVGDVSIIRPGVEIPPGPFNFRAVLRHIVNEFAVATGLRPAKSKSCRCHELPATSVSSTSTIHSTTAGG